ncbi:MAG: hypothetical protein ACO3JL_05225 [Myxococcota bacterium]
MKQSKTLEKSQVSCSSSPWGDRLRTASGNVRRREVTRWRPVALIGAVFLVAGHAEATRVKVHHLDSYADFAAGDFEGTRLDGTGGLRPGPALDVVTASLPGPVLALARGGDNALYAATARPGRIWRITEGREPELFAELPRPLVTALLPGPGDTLVAVTAPEGGAHFLDLRGKKPPRVVEASGVEMLLGAAMHEGILYVVGGGEEGVLLQLAKGATSFTRLAKVKEAHLRSIAVASGRSKGALRVVVGGGDEGVIYAFEEGRLRALLDAAPAEVTALAIDRQGRIFASLVDADGKLSSGGTSRDEEEDKDRSKPREVKSAEIVRIDDDGRSTVLWQSKQHGAYALALHRGALLVGTGARGRVYELDPEGKRRSAMLARVPDHDEVSALLPQRDGAVLVGTAHGGGVYRLSANDRKNGIYLSQTLDAGSLARYGAVDTMGLVPSGAAIKVQLRTGNTSVPDETWSSFSAALLGSGVPAVPRGRYAQLRVELVQGEASAAPRLVSVRASYLEENRAPEVERIEVLAPGWRVSFSEREPPDSRSVTFSERPFQAFLERPGSKLPTLGERPSGKQLWAPGWRTAYAWAEDPDKDALRYRYLIGRADSAGTVRTWELVKDWSEEPFYSFEAARLADGAYRLKVECDDAPTNGPARALSDGGETPVFRIDHQRPQIEAARAVRRESAYQVQFTARAAVPLAAVRCAGAGNEWLPLDPIDGLVDSPTERFDAFLPAGPLFDGVSCELLDEAGNHARADIPVTR